MSSVRFLNYKFCLNGAYSKTSKQAHSRPQLQVGQCAARPVGEQNCRRSIVEENEHFAVATVGRWTKFNGKQRSFIMSDDCCATVALQLFYSLATLSLSCCQTVALQSDNSSASMSCDSRMTVAWQSRCSWTILSPSCCTNAARLSGNSSAIISNDVLRCSRATVELQSLYNSASSTFPVRRCTPNWLHKAVCCIWFYQLIGRPKVSIDSTAADAW
jgi:hypothetical protein